MEKKFIKLYGARRTGTNFIYSLINNNCLDTEVFDNAFGGKHHKPRTNVDAFFKKIEKRDPKLLVYYKKIYAYLQKNSALNAIIIIKNPYSWYFSIEKYVNNRSPSKFNFDLEFTRYNFLYSVYRDFYNNPNSYGNQYGKVVKLKYEDLLIDPVTQIRNLCISFNIESKKEIFVPNKVNMSSLFNVSNRDFYLRNDGFGLPKATLSKINSILDWEVLNFYGYEKIV